MDLDALGNCLTTSACVVTQATSGLIIGMLLFLVAAGVTLRSHAEKLPLNPGGQGRASLPSATLRVISQTVIGETSTSPDAIAVLPARLMVSPP